MTKVIVRISGKYNDAKGKAKDYKIDDILDTSDWYAKSLLESGLVSDGKKAAKVVVGEVNGTHNITLLEFFNTAEKEELTKLHRVGNSLAEKIIGVRPIAALEDVIAIKGVSEKSIGELQEGFALGNVIESEDAIDAVPDIIAELQEQIGNTDDVKKKKIVE